MTGNRKIVIWCGDAANHRALANKIADKFNLCGIVIDKKMQMKKRPLLKKVFAAFQDRVFFRSINHAWSTLQQTYTKRYPAWPDVPLLDAESINSDQAYTFTKELTPDLIVVSGTSLVRSKMLSLKPGIGIINLHTGLSPYIRGGPNCTNWCIATKQYNMIGNTIMWINEGIDSGNIIASERTQLHGPGSLADIQWQVMEHAHLLYISVIDYLFNTKGSYNSVSQNQIASGNLYLTRMWNFSAKRELLNNLPYFLKNNRNEQDESIVTIPIKSSAHE
jgi:methionyl-tRNA formyltransferase